MNKEMEFISRLSEKASHISVEEQVLRETDEKIFARTCQLINHYGIDSVDVSGNKKKILSIPFSEYDQYINYAEHIKDEFPPIFDNTEGNKIKKKASFTRLLEVYFKESITEVEDFMGAAINKQLCVNNKIRTYEDTKNSQLIVEMIYG